LRFNTSVDEPGAIFGMVYGSFKSAYPKVEKMPILNLPEEIRMADENLIHQAWYKLMDESFSLGIGPRVIYLGRSGEYCGWSFFSQKINKIVDTLKKLNIVTSVDRVGLRYINFFDGDIFDGRIKLVASINDKIVQEETAVRTLMAGDRYKSRLNVANKAQVSTAGEARQGSVIDIDTFLASELDGFLDNAMAIIAEGHNEEKKVFFELLKEDFLATLHPEY